MSHTTRTLLVLALSAVPALAVDPMICRQARYDSGTYTSPGLNLEDAFGTIVSRPTQVRQVCDPAVVNGAPVSDPTAALVFHVGKDTPNSGTSTRPDVAITNGFGTWQLKLTRNEQLGFDSLLNGAGATQPFDSYRCYKARIIAGQPAWPLPVVTVQDGYEPSHSVQVQKPYRVCEPVSIDGSPIANPTAVLTCYGIKDLDGLTPFAPVPATVENLLGDYTVLVRARPKPELCVPSSQTILPTP
jgi:hypothetical protein